MKNYLGLINDKQRGTLLMSKKGWNEEIPNASRTIPVFE